MKTEKKKINLTMLSVFLVCGYALAGQTVFLEAANGSYASDPIPADGATIDDRTPALEWIPGVEAVYHKLYFSENFDDVNNRNPAVREVMIDPCRPYPMIPPLELGTTYYWLVDEVNSPSERWDARTVWSFTTISGKAEPNLPADGAVIDGELYPEPPETPTHIWTMLIFDPGPTAVKHTGYFSDDYSKVAGRAEDANMWSPPFFLDPEWDNVFFVGHPAVPPVTDSLVRGTTYYWCVDETDAQGNVFPGDVWSFTTVGGEAQCDYPPDGAVITGDIFTYLGEDYICTPLDFIPGATAVKHTVYFSDNYDDVANRIEDANLSLPPIGPGPWLGRYFVGFPESLIRGQIYYWCVDETDALGTTYPGDVWDFTILGFYAYAPSPPNEAVLVSVTPLLSWLPGFGVEEHDVYMGTSWEEVNNARFDPFNPPPEFLDTVTEPNILVTSLAFNTVYYWRVDQVNGRAPFAPGEYYYGDVWSFKTVISVCEKTYHVDGATGDNTNDGLSRETAFETIQYAIDKANDIDTILVWPGVYNETATNGINFMGKAITVKSAADAAVLEVPGFVAVTFVQGEDENSVFSNFVVRGSSTGIFALFANPTINNVTVVDNDNGVIADNANPLITNSIFYNNTNGDLFGSPNPITAQYSWLESQVNEPNIPLAGLVSHWQFDEGAGTIAYDSAGTNDGTIYGGPTWTAGLFGGALDFDGVNDYVDVGNDSSLMTTGDLTISAWIKANKNRACIYSHTWSDWRLGFGIGNDNHDGRLGFYTSSHGHWIKAGGSLADDTWHHVAVNLEGNMVRLYTDGFEIGNGIGAPASSLTGNANIGIYNYTWHFGGIIDEVAIYDRALSAEEVEAIYKAGLAGHEDGPLFADANNGDYHLLSERGRYRATTDEWLLDDVTSPCIDGGDPDVSPYNERMPNGGRINMGAYGNTAYASMSEWPIKGDINNDGRFNFMDIAILLDGWLEELPWAQQ